MKRQKTMGLSPPASSFFTCWVRLPSLRSWSGPWSWEARLAKSSRRRRSVALGVVAIVAVLGVGLDQGAGGGVHALQRLLVALVEDGGAADAVGLGDGGGLAVGGAGAQGGLGGARAGGERTEQREDRPPAHPALGAAGVLLDLVAGVGEDVVEEVAVGRGEAVGDVEGEPVAGEGSVLVEVAADVAAAALDEVTGEQLAALGAGQVGGAEVGVEEADEVGEGLVVAGVRGGGGEDEVAALVGGEVAQQLVALVAALLPEPGAGDAVVGLVDDDQLGAAEQELVAAAVGLDEVGGDDDVRVAVEERLVHHQAALEALDGAGEQQHGVDAELGRELALPLLGQGRASTAPLSAARSPGRGARRR